MGFRLVLVSVFLLFTTSGCGYRVAGTDSTVFRADVKSVSVPMFKNLTPRADIESIFTSAVIDELVNIAGVAVNPPEGEALLEGSIKEYSLTPVAFTSSDVASVYRLTVKFSVRLLRVKDNFILWEGMDMTDYEDFTVDIMNVASTRGSELEVFKKISRDSARLIRERMVEGF